ncbi:hypothetical protein FISHEDRAFT_60594 [Fistulina hepatica ATCC 64428]|uniref:Uncharacterized protein n=1 Tax=Fistulina hepatica ATCC 64428 TaxID=1128425 RepID=A0A0D7A5L6_9AGAR|nr:hypothetical protein FISHEDRAFT_60594 [Fistulina hepatica ATCC 64428]
MGRGSQLQGHRERGPRLSHTLFMKYYQQATGRGRHSDNTRTLLMALFGIALRAWKALPKQERDEWEAYLPKYRLEYHPPRSGHRTSRAPPPRSPGQLDILLDTRQILDNDFCHHTTFNTLDQQPQMLSPNDHHSSTWHLLHHCYPAEQQQNFQSESFGALSSALGPIINDVGPCATVTNATSRPALIQSRGPHGKPCFVLIVIGRGIDIGIEDDPGSLVLASALFLDPTAFTLSTIGAATDKAEIGRPKVARSGKPTAPSEGPQFIGQTWGLGRTSESGVRPVPDRLDGLYTAMFLRGGVGNFAGLGGCAMSLLLSREMACLLSFGYGTQGRGALGCADRVLELDDPMILVHKMAIGYPDRFAGGRLARLDSRCMCIAGFSGMRGKATHVTTNEGTLGVGSAGICAADRMIYVDLRAGGAAA